MKGGHGVVVSPVCVFLTFINIRLGVKSIVGGRTGGSTTNSFKLCQKAIILSRESKELCNLEESVVFPFADRRLFIISKIYGRCLPKFGRPVRFLISSIYYIFLPNTYSKSVGKTGCGRANRSTRLAIRK